MSRQLLLQWQVRVLNDMQAELHELTCLSLCSLSCYFARSGMTMAKRVVIVAVQAQEFSPSSARAPNRTAYNSDASKQLCWLQAKGKTVQKLIEIGLVEITSDRQAKNGTRIYLDPQAKCSYTLHASGYVRRISGSDRYQLNPTRKISRQTVWGISIPGVERVMVPKLSEQVELVLSRALSYRKLKGC